jgi:hypothetical protein
MLAHAGSKKSKVRFETEPTAVTIFSVKNFIVEPVLNEMNPDSSREIAHNHHLHFI